MFFACTKAKNLKTAGVGHQWSSPTHELMQPSHPLYKIFPRLDVEMVGVSDDHLVPGHSKIPN